MGDDALTLPMDGPPPGGGEELAMGATIGRYLVLAVLGRGGMGIVYEAYDPMLDRRIAVKLLRDVANDQVSAGRARMQREAQALARLSDANVIAVYDVGEHAGATYIAMELVTGTTLRDWQAQPAWREVLEKYIAAGRGLAAAHEGGLVHRDFKPENVLVGDDGRVRVTDFGLARLVTDADGPLPPTLATPSQLASNLTAAGTVMGTPTYMAPEQIDGGVVDERSDQFSWCVAAWEALYEEQPFIGVSLALRSAAMKTDVPKPPPSSPVPRAIGRILLRGLAPEPGARWPSMAALLAQLSRVTSTRRAWIVAGAMAAIAVGGGVFAIARAGRAEESVPPTCAQAGDAVLRLWTPAEQSTAQRAFGATGAAFAGDAFTAADRAIRGWRERWIHSAIESCEATRVRRTQSDAMLDLRSACLTRSLGDLGRTLAAFPQADRETVERAASLATHLPDLDQCDDPAALAGVTPPPRDPKPLRVVEANLSQLELKIRARKSIDETKALVAPAGLWVAASLAVGWRPVAARARHDLAELYFQTGAGKDARYVLLAAAADASAAGDLDLLVDTYIDLAEMDARLTSDFDLAQAWVDLAAGTLARMAPRPNKQLAMLRARGVVAEKSGHPRRSVAAYSEALAIAKTTGPQDELLVLSDVALVEAEVDRLDAAREHLERSLALAKRELGPHHPRLGQVEQDLGNIMYRMGRYALAEEHARIGLAIRAAAFGDDSVEAAGSYELVGLAELAQTRYPEAEADFARALRTFEARLGPENPDVLNAYNDIGGAHHRMGRYAESLANAERVLALREKTLGPDHPDVGQSLVNVAIEQKALGRWDGVDENYRRAIAIFEKAYGDTDITGIVHLDYAEALRVRGQLDAAGQHYAIAQAMLAKSMGEGNPLLAHVWNGEGQLEAARGHTDEAIRLLEQAVQLREKDADPNDLAESQFALAKLLEDRARARTLATAARDQYAKSGPAFAKRAAEADAWLAAVPE